PAPNTPLLIKYIPAISKTFTLRTVSDSDIPTLTKWQNSPRVAYFWKETGDENHQRAYVRKIWDTPHSVPCIGEIDDVPFAYFEIYWAAYDLLGGYYRANPYDRGAHALVGDEAFRGIAVHWMSAIMGYLLTDHPLTTRVVMEPRSDNGVIIGLLCNIGCRYMGTVKLPHKVSALLMTTRAWFWE
ncbi:N6-hydroxylysine acetyl transferase, partial [Gaertneriomyces semiglobifer]